jgi:enolase
MEADLERHAALLASLPGGVQLVGDDLLVTQVPKIEQAFSAQACNALLCKPNQVGTLTEAHHAFLTATTMGWSSVMSARSGETEDTTIVDLALGWGVPQFKVGSFARSERMAKWNQMIRIESEASVSHYMGGRPWGRVQ